MAAGTQWIGYRGAASFTQTGGTNSAANQLVLGWDVPTPVSYTLSNTGLLSAGNEWVGMSGSTNFTQSGGTHSVAGFLFVNAANYGLSAGLLSVAATNMWASANRPSSIRAAAHIRSPAAA